MTSTTRHGTQGTLDRASNGLLENEFGTKDPTAVVSKILEQGVVREAKVIFPTFALINDSH
jgi:hypothetical protein